MRQAHRYNIHGLPVVSRRLVSALMLRQARRQHHQAVRHSLQLQRPSRDKVHAKAEARPLSRVQIIHNHMAVVRLPRQLAAAVVHCQGPKAKVDLAQIAQLATRRGVLGIGKDVAAPAHVPGDKGPLDVQLAHVLLGRGAEQLVAVGHVVVVELQQAREEAAAQGRGHGALHPGLAPVAAHEVAVEHVAQAQVRDDVGKDLGRQLAEAGEAIQAHRAVDEAAADVQQVPRAEAVEQGVERLSPAPRAIVAPLGTIIGHLGFGLGLPHALGEI